MLRKAYKVLATMLVVSLTLGLLAFSAGATISPDTLTATLNPGESTTVTKTVTIPELPPRADVVFAFDLTGSMAPILSTAKARAGDIMTALDALGVDINYGVMSYMDYPRYYSSCGYSSVYGYSGDYAYRLDQPVTSDRSAVTTAINGLTLGSGADGPQDYTRFMYESYADPEVSWRPGAKRIVVNFGDNVPHDCNLNEGVPGKTGTWSTGGDPGRDEVMGTADDLDLQTVLGEMADHGVILLECHSSSYKQEYWQHWTSLTGGGFYLTTSGTLVDDVVAAITEGLAVPTLHGLHLAVTTPGFEDWLDSVVPASYDEVEPGETVTFEETIRVPSGTAPGTYTFTASALDDKNVSYGDQRVTITVPGAPPTPPPAPPIPGVSGWGLVALALLLGAGGALLLRRQMMHQSER